jgi:hypothetical protein
VVGAAGERGRSRREPRRLGDAVRVGEREDVAARVADTSVAGGVRPGHGLGAETRAGDVRRHGTSGPVGRAVVDDDHLERRRSVLGRERVEARTDRRDAIPHGHDDAHDRIGVHDRRM